MEGSTTAIWEAVRLVLLTRKFIKYTIDMASYGMIYIPSFVKIDPWINAILRFLLKNLRWYNVGINEGAINVMCVWDVIRFHDICLQTKINEVWFRL
jgi:hypothetical protein